MSTFRCPTLRTDFMMTTRVTHIVPIPPIPCRWLFDLWIIYLSDKDGAEIDGCLLRVETPFQNRGGPLNGPSRGPNQRLQRAGSDDPTETSKHTAI